MANSSRLIDWILKYSDLLQFKVIQLKWISDWMPGYFDYKVSIFARGKTHNGRGIDKNEAIAFSKASAEALERCATNGLDSPWNTSAYIDYVGARQRAYHELVGIDRTLCHHFCKKPFKQIDLKVLEYHFNLRVLKKMLDKNDLEIGLYELCPVSDAKICTMMAWHKNPNYKIRGFVNGFGCGADIKSAVVNATFECLRTMTAVFLGHAHSNIPLEKLEYPGSSSWHFWLTHNSLEAMNYFKRYLKPQKNLAVDFLPENLSIQDATFQRITTLDRIFPDLPLSIVQARSDKFIHPQFGPTVLDAHTLKRLEQFNNAPVEVDHNIPHFYG